MKSPIVVIIFNRPKHAKQLRDYLRTEELRELFVISDGAREGRTEEIELVKECRHLFCDWPGKVHFDFAPKNMGCKARISSGLNWVFEQTDRAIILEDDCFPHPHFFEFCDELLEIYYGNETVMSICGTKTFPMKSNEGDFLFTKYASSWGWATWRRAWANYEDQFRDYSFLKIIEELSRNLGSLRAAIYWYYLLRKVSKGSIDSWAYCWNISCFLRSGFHAYSNENLVINAGFGPEATHTIDMMPYMPQCYGEPLSFPLTLPSNIITSDEANQWIDDNIYSKSLTIRLQWMRQKFRKLVF